MNNCNVSFNRIALVLHDDCHVTVHNTTFLQNHRAAFDIGLHGRDRAHLALHNVSLLGTRQWCVPNEPYLSAKET